MGIVGLGGIGAVKSNTIKVGDKVKLKNWGNRYWQIKMFDNLSQTVNLKSAKDKNTLFTAKIVGKPILMNKGKLDTSIGEFLVSDIISK